MPASHSFISLAALEAHFPVKHFKKSSSARKEPDNPQYWPTKRKTFVLVTGIATVVNSTLNSSLPGNAIPSIVADFKLELANNDPLLVTPISVFLVGYIFGPLVFAPLSESLGRQRLLQVAFFAYTGFNLGCSLAPNWTSLLIFRLLAGISGSAPLSIVPGVIADMYSDPIARGRAIASFMTTVVVAPLVAPSISGALTAISWRWVFWAAVIMAGTTCLPLMFMPETSYHINRTHHCASRRQEGANLGSGYSENVSEAAKKKTKWRQVFTVVLLRPLRMLITEPIAATTCFYLAVIYAIFYMYFQVYPLIFQGVYGMTVTISGLMFLPIGVGACFSQIVFFFFDHYFERAQAAGESWVMAEGSRRLPLACVGGPLMGLSMFWLGWTAKETTPWFVPFLSGFFFGLGDLLIFTPLLNYLADSYGMFAASAMAASSSTRSIMGALLPLASYPLYDGLGIAWATTLLGSLTLLLSIIPFVFWRYSTTIRRKSKFCQHVQDMSSCNSDTPLPLEKSQTEIQRN
ncbi:unnamed protein product [Clonostachys rosea]|uniref:Major facilitator superfamily (MFS) profile domain-containing protein n=1 Tax=Bionectria ochroleuca TaxID=29856 RepID=A0ABY6V0M7_BIOOC|nr:unnamed protein product [Clonostachys rosea]